MRGKIHTTKLSMISPCKCHLAWTLRELIMSLKYHMPPSAVRHSLLSSFRYVCISHGPYCGSLCAIDTHGNVRDHASKIHPEGGLEVTLDKGGAQSAIQYRA